MVRSGKVWLLRKVNRKKDNDYIMIIIRHVCSFPEARWFWLYELSAPHVLSKDNRVHIEVFQLE